MAENIIPISTEDSVSFTFERLEQAEKLDLWTTEVYGSTFEINTALQGQFKDWAKAKFRLTKADSTTNFIHLKVNKLNVSNEKNSIFTGMGIEMLLTGRVNGKELNYKAKKSSVFPKEIKKSSISRMLKILVAKVNQYVDKQLYVPKAKD